MCEAAYDEGVGELRAELVVKLRLFALGRIREDLRFWVVGGEEGGIIAALLMVRATKPSSASSNSLRSEIRTSVGIFVWSSPIASYW